MWLFIGLLRLVLLVGPFPWGVYRFLPSPFLWHDERKCTILRSCWQTKPISDPLHPAAPQPRPCTVLTPFPPQGQAGIMGAYKYMQEIYRKKQSDVMRFLLRVRAWQYRHLNKLHRAPRPTRPEKARRLGYKAKQGESREHFLYCCRQRLSWSILVDNKWYL